MTPFTIIITAECGGTFDTPTGLIDFPHGEGTAYDHDMTCVYTITVERGKVVALNFTQFRLEAGPPYCHYDWLAVSNFMPEMVAAHLTTLHIHATLLAEFCFVQIHTKKE